MPSGHGPTKASRMVLPGDEPGSGLKLGRGGCGTCCGLAADHHCWVWVAIATCGAAGLIVGVTVGLVVPSYPFGEDSPMINSRTFSSICGRATSGVVKSMS